MKPSASTLSSRAPLAEEFRRRAGEGKERERIAAFVAGWIRRERLRDDIAGFGGAMRIEDHPEWADAEAIKACSASIRRDWNRDRESRHEAAG